MGQSENEYSWDYFDNKPIAIGVGDYYEVSKKAIPSEINTAIERRKHMKNWDEKELKNGEV